MTEEETIPELVPSEIPNDEDASPSAENNPQLESVIQTGVYALTGVNQAVTDTDDQNNDGIITIDQDSNDENNEAIEKSQIHQIENESLKNDETKNENTETQNDQQNEDEDNEKAADNQQNEEEESKEKNTDEQNKIDSNSKQDEENQTDTKNQQEDQNNSDQLNQQEEQAQVDPNLQHDEQIEPSLEQDNQKPNESNPESENVLEQVISDMAANLLPNEAETQTDSVNQTNETQTDLQTSQPESTDANPLSDMLGNVISILPTETDQNTPDNENEEQNTTEETQNENKEDEAQNPIEETPNENKEDEDQNATEENQNENENNDETNDNDQTEGMEVHDDYKEPNISWGTPQTPRIPCSYSVTHLPPLETTPELDEESKRFVERFEEQGKLPDPDKRTQVIQYIQREKVNSVVSNDFMNAARLQQTSQKLIQAINLAELGDVHAKKMDVLEDKLQETLQRLHEFQHETDEMIKNERTRLTIKREDLINSQEQNLNSFEDHWNDEDFLLRYAKPSSVLLQAKQIERTLVIAKDFEGAEYYKKKVAELEKQESHEAQKRAEREMRKQYRKLTSKQEEDLISFDEYAKTQLEQMARDRGIQLDALIARQTKLQSEIDEMKAVAKKEAKRSPSRQAQIAALPLLSSGTQRSTDPAMTPRTAQRYAQFKCTIKKPKITVKPLGSINQKRKKNVPAPRF